MGTDLTDHHLKTPALYELYRQLHASLGEGRDLGPPVRHHNNWREVTGVEFLGSFSRQAGGYRGLSDQVMDATFVLPAFKVRVFGSRALDRDKEHEYRAGEVDSTPLVHHYTEYFGDDFGLIHYANSNSKSHGTLLVISDSQDNAIEPLLASHFADAYFVDLRHYKKDVGVLFDFAKFKRQHGVTDFVIFGSGESVLKASAAVGSL